jgi:cell wall-associated NlpC family hydrolase
MPFVTCIVPTAPLRKEDAHRSEMVSQLLFGETAEVLEETKTFTKLRCLYDGYEGWCQNTQLTTVSEEQLQQNTEQLTASWDTVIEFNGQPMHLPLGSSLGLLIDGKAQIGPYSFSYEGTPFDPSTAIVSGDALKERAWQYLNTPYLWGGRSVFGIDCSGFVQQVFRFFQQPLLRDAYQQATTGEVVGFLQEAICGDLAYFDNEEGRITHVGILLNSDTIIHSSGKVRVDKVDSMGIISSDTGERTHKLRIIKRNF